jgi:PAT family beta-lactamase induction signal transducer AmpG
MGSAPDVPRKQFAARVFALRLPNLLATRRRRLVAFFSLYVTEGIPLGFAAVAIAYHLRKLGVGPAEIGAFVGSLYVPWAFKWAFGPLVDVFRSQRFGHRRAWIIGTQLMMAGTLAALVVLELPQQLALFTAVLLVHNTFAAMQDVAIDALAVNSLREDERGLANGLMFAGASVGQLIGGSGVLFLAAYTGFTPTFFFVALAILAVTGLVAWPMKEAVVQAVADSAAARGLRHAAREMREFAVASFRSFLQTRGAFAGVGFSLLPAGAMALGLALRSNLSAELGLDETETAQLEFWSNVIAAAAMVLGGWLSDKLGRRRTLFVYLALMSLPTAWLAWRLQQLGYVMPRNPEAGVVREPLLAAALWTATLVYNVFLGLMYGTRSAIMMDVTNPKVAATQFTAYMAMANLAIAYSATWQGIAVEAFGYPKTLLVDALVGLLNLLLVFSLKPALGTEHVDAPARRARWTATVLAVLCLGWLPFMLQPELFGAARPIVNTFFTLVFVASALMLLAAAAMLPRSILTRAAPWVALALLAIYARRFVESGPLLHTLLGLTVIAGALLLAALARYRWDELRAAD